MQKPNNPCKAIEVTPATDDKAVYEPVSTIDLNAPGIIVYVSGRDVDKIDNIEIYLKDNER